MSQGSFEWLEAPGNDFNFDRGLVVWGTQFKLCGRTDKVHPNEVDILPHFGLLALILQRFDLSL